MEFFSNRGPELMEIVFASRYFTVELNRKKVIFIKTQFCQEPLYRIFRLTESEMEAVSEWDG
ncbi:hypothetical protein LEP1GSC058_2373 [Leptospira fainei serovar Hurstbridge str. BUT 6]|uniref:Uncharacterized protein n=1 Tax=Leptospira fainei serovar Hurstbridge str. BUT 6 TaxID=1193011 RepID=S3VXM2_9LEPT|nr:hypothetical protein LEP1GSC058_2373 [Leptospira fainei serovar Hurstbridge str. BUT 6]